MESELSLIVEVLRRHCPQVNAIQRFNFVRQFLRDRQEYRLPEQDARMSAIRIADEHGLQWQS